MRVGGLTVMIGVWERGAVFDREIVGGISGAREREGKNSGFCKGGEGNKERVALSNDGEEGE